MVCGEFARASVHRVSGDEQASEVGSVILGGEARKACEVGRVTDFLRFDGGPKEFARQANRGGAQDVLFPRTIVLRGDVMSNCHVRARLFIFKFL